MRRTYSGIKFPEKTMQELLPLRNKVRELQDNCRPFGDQWCALDKVNRAIDECAAFFTKDPTFFHRKPPVGNGC